jgi:transposase-like protein
MKKKRHSPEQIIRKLREAEGHLSAGMTIAQACQKLEVSEQTFHRWRNQYGGMKADAARPSVALSLATQAMASPADRSQADRRPAPSTPRRGA